MNLIDERWKRILICLLFAGFLSAGISRITNEHIKISSIISAIIVYALLSKIYRRTQKQN
jgi:hypothetical protein